MAERLAGHYSDCIAELPLLFDALHFTNMVGTTHQLDRRSTRRRPTASLVFDSISFHFGRGAVQNGGSSALVSQPIGQCRDWTARFENIETLQFAVTHSSWIVFSFLRCISAKHKASDLRLNS